MGIFVFGWYDHNNLGDEAFKPSIRSLFPEKQFTFGNSIPKDINTLYDELWVGCGSFLDQQIKGIELVTIPIGFIGVGIGHTVTPQNLEALKRARFVIVRDRLSLERYPTALQAPDIVFSRRDMPTPTPKAKDAPKKVVVLLNDFFSPQWECPEWKSFSYYRFTQEFSKVCESLISRGYLLQFLPMCIAAEVDDRKIAAGVIGRIKTKKKTEWYVSGALSEEYFLTQVAQADLVITQRLHGAIYSILLGKPPIVIRAHDKLAGLVEDCKWDGHLDYYGFTDSEFFNILKKIENKTVASDYILNAQKRWAELAQMITKSDREK